MAKHKQIVKELKRPDQFVDFWTGSWQRVLEVLAPRKKPAIAALVAVAVVVVGAAIFNYWDGNRHQGASQKLSRIQDIANADLLTDAPDPNAPNSPNAEAPRKDDAPRFKTAAEREGVVVKELDQFLAGEAPANLKDQAFVMKGAALLALGRFDDAAAAYQSALGAKLDVRLRFLAHEGLGYTYEGKGELDKALAEFAKLSTDASAFGGFYEDRALYHRARLTALKGDKSGAVGIYKQILTKVPDSGLKDEISDRLALIEAK